MKKYPGLEKRIYAWLHPIVLHPDVLLTDVTFEDQNSPALRGPYLSVDFLNVTTDKRPEVKTDYTADMGDEIRETVLYRATVELMLKVISNEGAMAQAERIKSLFWTSASGEEMFRQNIGINEMDNTQDRSYLSGPSFKQRADFRLDLNIVTSYHELIPTIGTLPISGISDAGRAIMDEDITE